MQGQDAAFSREISSLRRCLTKDLEEVREPFPQIPGERPAVTKAFRRDHAWCVQGRRGGKCGWRGSIGEVRVIGNEIREQMGASRDRPWTV